MLLLSFFPLLMNSFLFLETKLMKCQNGKIFSFAKEKNSLLLKHTCSLFPQCKFLMYVMLKWEKKKKKRAYSFVCVYVCVCVCVSLSRKEKETALEFIEDGGHVAVFLMKGHPPGHGRWQSSDDTTDMPPSHLLLYFYIWILYTVSNISLFS